MATKVERPEFDTKIPSQKAHAKNLIAGYEMNWKGKSVLISSIAVNDTKVAVKPSDDEDIIEMLPEDEVQVRLPAKNKVRETEKLPI